MPPPNDGPAVQAAFLGQTRFPVGFQGKSFSGALAPSATALVLGLALDRGYFIVPAGPPSVEAPSLPTFDARLSFASTLPPGEHALELAAVDAQGRVGEHKRVPFTLTLAAAPVLGGGDITLQGGDGDLHILANLSFASAVTLSSQRNLIIEATVATTGSSSDLTLIGDTDLDGIGGVYIKTDGFVSSARDLFITGSELTNDLGFLETNEAIRIDGEGTVIAPVIQVQAVRNITPALGNDAIAMLKDTSLLSVLAVREITQLSRIHVNRSFQYDQTFAVLVALYLAMTITLSLLLSWYRSRLGLDHD